jgi:dienelactone hydrolase
MSHPVKLSQNSTATAVRTPPVSSEEFIRSEVKKKTDEVYRHSLEVAKFETTHLFPTHRDAQTVRKARYRRLYQVLPLLTGRYRVGHASGVIEGPKNSCGIGDRAIGIELYAPTQTKNANKTLIKLNPQEELGVSLISEQIHTLYTHSLDQIDPIGKLPILIFSHGFGVDPMEYRPLLEELASHGILVLSLNHPSSSGYAPFTQVSHLKTQDEQASAQAENIRYVVDAIRGGNLKDVNNLGLADQIVLAGHSLGGAASIIVARKDPQIKGCINVDGGLKGKEETRTEKLPMPVLMILSDHASDQSDDMQKMKQEWGAFSKNSSAESHAIPGVDHVDFCTIYRALGWMNGDNTMDSALRAQSIASRIMVQFMHSAYRNG